jgi:hypothetical protein
MDNQQFYNLNFNNSASRFRKLQFHSFNPKLKLAFEVEKSLSLDTKSTQTSGGSEACEQSHAKKAASPAEDIHLHDSVHVETPGMCTGKTAFHHYSRLIS